MRNVRKVWNYLKGNKGLHYIYHVDDGLATIQRKKNYIGVIKLPLVSVKRSLYLVLCTAKMFKLHR